MSAELLFADLEDGVPVSLELDGQRVCVVRVGAEVYALADQCSHQAMPLSAGYIVSEGEEGSPVQLECAWHGARFNCATGEATRGPALDPVATYDVRVVDGRVIVTPHPRSARQ